MNDIICVAHLVAPNKCVRHLVSHLFPTSGTYSDAAPTSTNFDILKRNFRFSGCVTYSNLTGLILYAMRNFVGLFLRGLKTFTVGFLNETNYRG